MRGVGEEPLERIDMVIATWEPMATHIGQEFGATYRGHYLSVSTIADPKEWFWSMTHPRCKDRKGEPERGAAGKADSVDAAQRLAMGAVDSAPCQRRRRG